MSNPDAAFGLKVGDRIELVSMSDDPLPMNPGATGTVVGFCDTPRFEQIRVKWDPCVGRSLALVPESDVWRIIDLADQQ